MSNNFNGISPEKINLLTDLLEKSKTVNAKQMIPFLLNAAAKANEQNISFSDDETKLILDTLRKNMNSGQIAQMEKIISLSKNIHRNS